MGTVTEKSMRQKKQTAKQKKRRETISIKKNKFDELNIKK